MKSYYYLDYLHREIFLEEEDIQTVPESGRADDACSAIAEKPYVVEQFMADSFRTLKDVASRLCDSPDIKSRHDALMYIVWRVALDIKEWRTLSHSEAAVKVTREDGFVWLLVSAENARKLWEADVFSLYRLYADDSESLIESEAELESTIKGGYQIGIEVGFASVMDHAARMKHPVGIGKFPHTRLRFTAGTSVRDSFFQCVFFSVRVIIKVLYLIKSEGTVSVELSD